MNNNKTNVQIIPAKKLIVPNDNLSKKIFNLTQADLKYWLERQRLKFIEMANHPQFGEILSPIELTVDDETFTLSEPLDQFHCAVLCAGISELYAGNHQTTVPIIYRAITGKVNRGSDADPSKKQLIDIKNAIDLLMRLQLTYTPTHLCELTRYNNGNPKKIVSALLPCKRLEFTTINGQNANIIELLSESPLLTSAQLKNNQILTYKTELLDVPYMNNSRMNIGLKHYTMRRVQEISLHRQLQPIITFADVFFKCQIEKANLKTKKDAREVIVIFIEHLKSKGVITSFEVIKHGNSFYSIELVPVRKGKTNQ